MPANRLSLHLTQAYQQRLSVTRQRVRGSAVQRWPSAASLSDSRWTEEAAQLVATAQTEAIRATGGYLAAILTSEFGRREGGPAITSRDYAGKTSDGRPLIEALQSPLIGVYAKLKEGKSDQEALRYGLDRATRQVGMYFDFAHRQALLDAIHADDRFNGWRRATTGTCGACLAVAGELSHALWFPVHPGCECVSEPAVSGIFDRFPRPTGTVLFAAKSKEEQNAAVGPAAAQLLREGRIQLSELVEHEELDSTDHGFITQKPVDRLEVPTPTA